MGGHGGEGAVIAGVKPVIVWAAFINYTVDVTICMYICQCLQRSKGGL